MMRGIVNCPNCNSAMTSLTLDGQLGRNVDIDQCTACQAFWFDAHESLQLTPAATLKLFTVIGQQATAAKTPLGDILKCPRCSMRLVPTHDMQMNTAFQYSRCPHDNGRFISYVDFLREKNFLKPLSPQQLAELRQNVQTINCSSCGAPIDLAHDSACSHCGAPLSMIDMAQIKQVISGLQQADRSNQPVDPTLPLQLAAARSEVETELAPYSHDEHYWKDASRLGLVGAGLTAVARWLFED
jgi:Zn-finger nucleic acid-binding protein